MLIICINKNMATATWIFFFPGEIIEANGAIILRAKMMWTWDMCGNSFMSSSSEGINKRFIILVLLKALISHDKTRTFLWVMEVLAGEENSAPETCSWAKTTSTCALFSFHQIPGKRRDKNCQTQPGVPNEQRRAGAAVSDIMLT